MLNKTTTMKTDNKIPFFALAFYDLPLKFSRHCFVFPRTFAMPISFQFTMDISRGNESEGEANN